MKLIRSLLLFSLILGSANVFAKGGDDVGNGGFAYKQSVIILKMATSELEEKIKTSTFEPLEKNPSWRQILQSTLKYIELDKLSKKDQYRDGRLLQMNYVVRPARVIVLKAYFQAFAGKTDTELEDASLQVQKLLVHEAAHIWGYKEDDAEKFAVDFLKHDSSVRPAGIDIQAGFCSCINGASDIVGSCDKFCKSKPKSDQPILYVNTLLSEAILKHSKLGNLYNWCNVQLSNDQTTPQCQLEASDGMRTLKIPVSLTPGQNSFEANVQTLSKNRAWVLKLVESKTGSNLSSSEFRMTRINQPPPAEEYPVGLLKTIPINQYTCLIYGGLTNSSGDTLRTTFVREFYYFQHQSSPLPMPPVKPGSQSLFVCHDEMMNSGEDSADYERLEVMPEVMTLLNPADPRLKKSNNKLIMNKILEERLLKEYGVVKQVNLFNLMSFVDRPVSVPSSLGFIMASLNNKETGDSYCPTYSDYNSADPLLNLLGDYVGETEGLFLAEKEAEIVRDENGYKTMYGTMFVRENIVRDYGFYVQNGQRVRADFNAMKSQTIHFYWPAIEDIDPLLSAGRKMYTIRTASRLNGHKPTGLPLEPTTDKRVGCIPKL